MLRSELFKRVLIDPVARGASELFVLSGYASASMVTQHFARVREVTKNPISLDLVVGMTGRDGIDRTNLLGFQAIPRQVGGNSFNCSFTTDGISDHSKLYVWCDASGPLEAFMGSVNYTQFGFGLGGAQNFHTETCVEVDPSEALDIVLSAARGTIGYLNPDIPNHLKIYDKPDEKATQAVGANEPFSSGDYVTLPLVQTKGEMRGMPHKSSGLNWGQREGREPNQAYIPIPSTVAASKLLPPRGVHFQLVTDDGNVFMATVAQDGDKAIETPENNSLLGKYIRSRLGLPLGVFVDKEDLDRYGSNGVRLRRIDEYLYEMDFSRGIKFDFEQAT